MDRLTAACWLRFNTGLFLRLAKVARFEMQICKDGLLFAAGGGKSDTFGKHPLGMQANFPWTRTQVALKACMAPLRCDSLVHCIVCELVC